MREPQPQPRAKRSAGRGKTPLVPPIGERVSERGTGASKTRSATAALPIVNGTRAWPRRKHRPLIAGNWKMNGLAASAAELQAIIAASAPLAPKADLLICPPATLVDGLCDPRARFGGRNRRPGLPSGGLRRPYRRYFGGNAQGRGRLVRHRRPFRTPRRPWRDGFGREREGDAAWRAGLTAIVCVGETRAERDSGKTLEVVGRQLAGSVPDGATADNLVIAYEPVWAIGTGLTPTVKDVEQVHGFIREKLTGSVPGRRRRRSASCMADRSSRRTLRNCCRSPTSTAR